MALGNLDLGGLLKTILDSVNNPPDPNAIAAQQMQAASQLGGQQAAQALAARGITLGSGLGQQFLQQVLAPQMNAIRQAQQQAAMSRWHTMLGLLPTVVGLLQRQYQASQGGGRGGYAGYGSGSLEIPDWSDVEQERQDAFRGLTGAGIHSPGIIDTGKGWNVYDPAARTWSFQPYQQTGPQPALPASVDGSTDTSGDDTSGDQ